MFNIVMKSPVVEFNIAISRLLILLVNIKSHFNIYKYVEK
jgi:hypothetical protein